MKASELLARRQSRKEELRNIVKIPLFGLEDIYGLNLGDGDLVVLFSPPKAGKTTVALNWVWRIAKQGIHVTVVSTESVMTAERYALCLLALEVSDSLIRNEYYGESIGPDLLDRILLSDDPKWLCNEYNKSYVWEIIEDSMLRFSNYDIDIHGAALEDGGMVNADNLFMLMRSVVTPSVFVLDQISQISLPNDLDPAPSAIKIMKGLAQIIKERKLATIVVSQVSTVSSREGKDAPLGGNLITAEANLGLKPTRDGDKLLLVSPPGYSRHTPPFSIEYDIEPTSGLMLDSKVLGVRD